MTTETRFQNDPMLSRAAAPGSAARQIPRRLRGMLSLDDFEEAARAYLPRSIFAYVSSGCETDRSRDRNRSVFADYAFVSRALRPTAGRSLETQLLGRRWAAPFGIAPMGISALSAYRGDLVQAQAAAAMNVPMIMSGSSLIPMEEVARANPQAWFQAYVPGEPQRILALVDRVARAGFGTLVVTVDVPAPGNRENNIRAGFSTPLRLGPRLVWDGLTHPRWLVGTALRTLLRHGMPHFENARAERGGPIVSSNVLRDFGARDHLDWDHLSLIREHWKGRLVVKGILHVDDALAARALGADGVILSNHGGRQLDGAVSPLRILPGVVQALGADYPVMIDSGFRRGSEVLIALALGAKFVFVGRPFNYAGAVAGEAGVRHAIDVLASEMGRNMAMLGVRSPAEMHPGHLMPA